MKRQQYSAMFQKDGGGLFNLFQKSISFGIAQSHLQCYTQGRRRLCRAWWNIMMRVTMMMIVVEVMMIVITMCCLPGGSNPWRSWASRQSHPALSITISPIFGQSDLFQGVVPIDISVAGLVDARSYAGSSLACRVRVGWRPAARALRQVSVNISISISIAKIIQITCSHALTYSRKRASFLRVS